MTTSRRKSRIDAVVEVRTEDTRTAAQQAHDIAQALRRAGFTVNDLVLYSRDGQSPAQRPEGRTTPASGMR